MSYTKQVALRSGFSLLASLVLLGCGGATGDDAGGAKAITRLTGAGATFPYPIYSKWFDAYARETGVEVNYQSIGSGGGVRQFMQATVDFGATDGPMTDEEIAGVEGNVLHIPTVLGADALTYNLPSLGEHQLRLDAGAVADIFLGRITKWNDPRLAALNPGVTLPNRDLIVVHRSDGSGTTFVFVDYLAKVSTTWQEQVGVGKSVNWPVGLGGKGNEGVTQQVRQLEGTIGYVELVYAVSNGLPVASVQNAAGQFVTPSLDAVTAAAAGVAMGPDTDFRVSITNAMGEASYPIASYTWLLVHRNNPDAAKAGAIQSFLRWILTPEAQAMATDLGYAPLPESVAALARTRVESLMSGGQVLK
jgi:phosphate transport system substrate-binding protein